MASATLILINPEMRSNKYWNIETNGPEAITDYGRIGSKGSIVKKQFLTTNQCERWATNKISSKLKKGYKEAITSELISQAFIMFISGLTSSYSKKEVIYRQDHFGKFATIEFVNGDSNNLIFRHYYSNGAIKSEQCWVGEKRNGHYIGWHSNGNKYWERVYKNNKLISQ